jgi:hypothetical protein
MSDFAIFILSRVFYGGGKPEFPKKLKNFQQGRVPGQAGYRLEPQNDWPARAPRFASRSTIFDPHCGHAGVSRTPKSLGTLGAAVFCEVRGLRRPRINLTKAFSMRLPTKASTSPKTIKRNTIGRIPTIAFLNSAVISECVFRYQSTSASQLSILALRPIQSAICTSVPTDGQRAESRRR